MKFFFSLDIKLVAVLSSVLLVGLILIQQISLPHFFNNFNPIISGIEKKIAHCQTIPEYNRTLGKVVISLSIKDSSLKLHHAILQNLPEYTKIFLLTPSTYLKQIQKEAQNLPYGKRLHFIPYRITQWPEISFYLLFAEKEKLQHGDAINKAGIRGSIWAQDLFEVIHSPKGKPIILVSEIHKYYFSPKGKYDSQVNRDNSYISILSSVGMDVQTIPLAFMGGNILVDNFQGKRIIFCGSDILKKTRAVWKAVYDRNISDLQMKKLIKRVFNADSVVILGSESVQPRLMFHLDQAMLFLPDGNVCVVRIVKSNINNKTSIEEVRDVELFLATVRGRLKKLGYRIIDIEMSEQNLVRFQHYINAIPYTDADTGNKKILMPVFPANQSDLDRNLIDKNKKVFETMGYQVIQVPTQVNEVNGGIHCMMNVLE